MARVESGDIEIVVVYAREDVQPVITRPVFVLPLRIGIDVVDHPIRDVGRVAENEEQLAELLGNFLVERLVLVIVVDPREVDSPFRILGPDGNGRLFQSK